MSAIKNIINSNDRGFVSNGSWFGTSGNANFNTVENITLEHAERVLNYDVEKLPLFMRKSTEGLSLNPYEKVAKAYCLYRPDIDTVLYPTVGEDYTIAPNSQLLKHVEAMLIQGRRNDIDISIDSVLTLGSGQSCIVNLNIAETIIDGDVSKTVTRMIMSNAFGGNSYQQGCYNFRARCANMTRMIFGQAKGNGTYRKVRHTKNVNNIVDRAMCELQDVLFNINTYNEILSELNSIQVDNEYVENFLETMFPTKEKEGRGLTINQNKQEEILNIFEGKEDLKNLPHSRYRMFNAITDFTSRGGAVKTNKTNEGKVFVGQLNGTGDKINQRALSLLTV